jgi:hypothetical protein
METAVLRRLAEVKSYGDLSEENNVCWNDARTLQPGNVFPALTAQGEGHELLLDAQHQGLNCAIVSYINKILILS